MFKKLRLWLIKKLNAIPNEVHLQIKEKKTTLSTVTLAKTINIPSQEQLFDGLVVDRIKEKLAYEFGKEVLKYAKVNTQELGAFDNYDVRVTIVVPENRIGVDIFDY